MANDSRVVATVFHLAARKVDFCLAGIDVQPGPLSRRDHRFAHHRRSVETARN